MDFEVDEVGPVGDPLVEVVAGGRAVELEAGGAVGGHPRVDILNSLGHEAAAGAEALADGVGVAGLETLDDEVKGHRGSTAGRGVRFNEEHRLRHCVPTSGGTRLHCPPNPTSGDDRLRIKRRASVEREHYFELRRW